MGSEEAGRLKSGVILTLATKSLTEPTKGPEKKQLYSVTSESSARDKKIILTADARGHTRTGKIKEGKRGGWEAGRLGR